MTWQEDVKAWVTAADARRRAEIDREYHVYLIVTMARDGQTRRYLARCQSAGDAHDLGADSIMSGQYYDVYVRRVDSSEDLYKQMASEIALGRIKHLIPVIEETVTNVIVEH